MMRILLAATCLMTALPSLARAQGETPGFLHMNASRTMMRNSEDVTIHVGLFQDSRDTPGWRPARDEDLWFEGIFRRGDWPTAQRFRYTDGGRCPAAVAILRQVRQLSMPRPVLPIPHNGEDEDGLSVMLDGRVYALSVDAGDYGGQAVGGFSISSNVETELAEWSERFIRALEPCWSTTVPEGMNSYRGTAGDARGWAARSRDAAAAAQSPQP